MDFKRVFLVFAFLVGCIALPTPKENDFSKFFEHMDKGSRIVGGTLAPAGSHPHMVALSSGLMVRGLICGASLVSRRSILTAAHCIDAVYSGGVLSTSLRATVGTTRWTTGGFDYRLERNVTHPNYIAATIRNDLSLLITTAEVALSNLVQVIPITYDFIPAGVQSRVAGWGRISGGGALSSTLQELTISTIDADDCVRLVSQASIDFNIPAPAVEPNIEVCVFRSEGFGTCNGDSGSALSRADTGQQFGVVSWGFACARGAPDVFVRLSAFQSWLQTNII